eukprot:GHVU01227422.1.p1 GENE.GHVU01227422.1~~GHVU01227422.1.p1  ORF type:complete len:456 (-),score=13.64 GHVU01227422.1:800-2167(-)
MNSYVSSFNSILQACDPHGWPEPSALELISGGGGNDGFEVTSHLHRPGMLSMPPPPNAPKSDWGDIHIHHAPRQSRFGLHEGATVGSRDDGDGCSGADVMSSRGDDMLLVAGSRRSCAETSSSAQPPSADRWAVFASERLNGVATTTTTTAAYLGGRDDQRLFGLPCSSPSARGGGSAPADNRCSGRMAHLPMSNGDDHRSLSFPLSKHVMDSSLGVTGPRYLGGDADSHSAGSGCNTTTTNRSIASEQHNGLPRGNCGANLPLRTEPMARTAPPAELPPLHPHHRLHRQQLQNDPIRPLNSAGPHHHLVDQETPRVGLVATEGHSQLHLSIPMHPPQQGSARQGDEAGRNGLLQLPQLARNSPSPSSDSIIHNGFDEFPLHHSINQCHGDLFVDPFKPFQGTSMSTSRFSPLCADHLLCSDGGDGVILFGGPPYVDAAFNYGFYDYNDVQISPF